MAPQNAHLRIPSGIREPQDSQLVKGSSSIIGDAELNRFPLNQSDNEIRMITAKETISAPRSHAGSIELVSVTLMGDIRYLAPTLVTSIV